MSITFGEALASLHSDWHDAVLDLEHDLGGRDPPGAQQKVRTAAFNSRAGVAQMTGKNFEVGKSLMWTHRLEEAGCQCRHNLETEERIERGVSGNSERSGKCPLTLKLRTGGVTAFAIPLARISLAGRGLQDPDVPALLSAMRGNRTLTELSLHGNGVSNGGARLIAKFLSEDNNALCDLDLGSNAIGDAGAGCLAEALRGNATLTELSLDGNPIRAAGLRELMAVASANPFCHIVLPEYKPVNECKAEAFEQPKAEEVAG